MTVMHSGQSTDRGQPSQEHQTPPLYYPQALVSMKAASYNSDAHTVEWVMSDETKDRDGEVLRANGWQVRGSIPLLWGHRSFGDSPQIVLGKVESVQISGSKLVGLVRFSTTNPLGQMAEAMVAEGVLENGSVGFDPLAWTDPDGSEHTRVPGGPYPFPKAGRVYTKQELAEFSIVPVPSNPNAIAKMAKVFDRMPDTTATAQLLARIDAMERKIQTLATRDEQRNEVDDWDEWLADEPKGEENDDDFWS